jgi:hypothetical protein
VKLLAAEPVEPYEFNQTIQDGKITLSFVNNTDESAGGNYLIAVYDTRGRLVDVAQKAFSASAGATAQYTIPAELRAKYPAGSFTWKAFAWDNSFVPLTQALKID